MRNLPPGNVKRARSLILAVTLCLLGASRAKAQGVAPPEEHPRRVFALTLSPIHLALPVVELTGEARVHDKVGLAGILGAGTVKVDNSTNGKTSVAVYEVGVQGRYYALGDFRHGAQIGAELMYLHASAASGSTSAVADGFAVGPFVGYKYTADIGFTFDGQIGYQRLGIGGSTNNGTPTTTHHENAVLLNLNVGWSF